MDHSNIREIINKIVMETSGKALAVPVHIHDLEPYGYAIGIEVRQYDPVWLNLEIEDDKIEEYLRKELPNIGALRCIFAKVVRNTFLDRKLNDFRSPYDLKRLDK